MAVSAAIGVNHGEAIVRYVASGYLRLSMPAPIVNWLPTRCAARGDRIPNRTVVAQIVGKVQSTSRLVEHRDADMRIQVGEVDFVRPAAETSERRHSSGNLRRCHCCSKSGHDHQECEMK